jgi:hypothetical protein
MVSAPALGVKSHPSPQESKIEEGVEHLALPLVPTSAHMVRTAAGDGSGRPAARSGWCSGCR